jgi:hypothetical protein
VTPPMYVRVAEVVLGWRRIAALRGEHGPRAMMPAWWALGLRVALVGVTLLVAGIVEPVLVRALLSGFAVLIGLQAGAAAAIKWAMGPSGPDDAV